LIKQGESFFLAIGRINDQELRVVGFQAHGKNTSTDPISDINGFVRSDRTNEQRPIYLAAEDLTPDPNRPAYVPVPMLPTSPDDTFGIPGLADLDIQTFDQPFMQNGIDGVPISRFMREFGAFTLILNYDGITVERHFRTDQMMSQVALLEKQTHSQNTSTPRIARKPTARPVPSRTMTPIVITPPQQPAPRP
jgi:hypothetical protein